MIRSIILMVTMILMLGIKTTTAQNIQLVDREWVTAMGQNKSDTVYVINFWATWCKPCIEELPHFEKLNSAYQHQKVKVILVSCDFTKQLDSRVVPFVKNKNLKSDVRFMNETDPNTWIDRVDPQFSGAIPATLILKGSSNFRTFKEGETNYEELEQIIKPLIQ